MVQVRKWILRNSNHHQELIQPGREDTMPALGTAAFLLLIRATGVNKDKNFFLFIIK